MKYAMMTMVAMGSVMMMGMGTSLAAPPSSCSSIAGGLQYQDAYKLQARRLENLFKNNYGCLRLEDFMRDAYRQSGTAGISDPCRAAGIRDAANDTVKKVSDDCLRTSDASSVIEEETAAESGLALRNQGECTENGLEMGKFAAGSYCGSFGAFGAPTSTCSALAAFACERAFRNFVNQDDRCRAKAYADSNFDEAVRSACAPSE
ncbi:hypothetical protein [Polyangium sp. 6x1]|uniref:hypothetical protein n=1 Tax=Polyangium sp. 6x1 TaxID=3042689 RepID=UPI0024829A48|nr:hypothetical protein [Polyangium sp. 6x1]MDI1451569.1 hypothetical protein [Polyangium sp. 6x1]